MIGGNLLYSFLTLHRYGVISSVSNEGKPQSALVGFAVTPGLEIIFDTVKSSRKYPNLLAIPACSFVVGWDREQTVQFEGIARELIAPALQPYQDIYFKTWPECAAHMSWPDIAYFVIQPRWIRYSDYDQKPPAIQELTIEPSGRWVWS